MDREEYFISSINDLSERKKQKQSKKVKRLRNNLNIINKQDRINNLKKNNCMCCYSLLCPDRWSPAMRIIQIIQEYESFINSLKTIQKKRMFKKINLPDDMIGYILDFL